MGLFDFFKKIVSDADRWELLDSERRIDLVAMPILERLGAGIEQDRARKTNTGSDAELTGALEGFPVRVSISWSGTIEVEVRYDEELASLDLEHDPEADTESWDKKKRRFSVAPGVFMDDDVKQRLALDALPAELRSRMVDAMVRTPLSTLRSRAGETQLVTHNGMTKLVPVEKKLEELLRLALEIAKGRGAEPSPRPGAPVDPRRPFAGWRHLGQEEKWSRAIAFAEHLAPRVQATIESDREERRVEIRWKEKGIPVRISLNLDFLHVEPGAIAKGFKRTLDLYWDPKLTVREDAGDPWSEETEIVFLAPSIVLRGDEEDVRAQMAILRAVPTTLLDELFAVMTRHRLAWVNLEDELLSVNMPDWPKTDAGTAAIEVARVFGRVVAALPQEAAGPSRDRVVRCKFCRGLWFPSEERATCTHCGAPA